MRRVTDLLCWLGLFLCLAVAPVAAQVQFGTGVICDTVEQVESFAVHSAKGEDTVKAIASVNTEANSEHACGYVMVAFVEGPEAKQLVKGDNAVRIVEIMVVGVNLGHGWRPTVPFKQFTAFNMEGKST